MSRFKATFDSDARLFLGFVAGGIVLMVVMKVLGIPQLILSPAMVLLVMAYTAVVLIFPRLYLRHDQAGDNAYYLGLIFTLLSMIFALYSIGQRLTLETDEGFSEAEALIGDFGLALATTLAGIIARLILHQMRKDPADVERQTRMELAAAAENMRQQIKDLSIQLGGFFDELSQRHNDYIREVSDAQLESLEKITTANEESAEAITRRVRLISSDMEEFHTDLRNGTQRLSEVLSEAAKQLEKESSGAAGSLRSLGGLAEATSTARAQVIGLSAALSETIPDIKKASDNISGLADTVTRIRDEGAETSGQMQEKLAQVDSRLEDMLARIQQQVDALAGTTEKLSEVSLRSGDAVLQSEEGAIQVLNGLAAALRKAEQEDA